MEAMATKWAKVFKATHNASADQVKQ